MISRPAKIFLLATAACSALLFSSRAEVVSATIQTPPPAKTGYFKLGSNKNPAGHEISVNSRCLLLDGQPWFPVMGEFHYARVPENEWRDELLKMKAGGVDIVSTYVFWIHHEEIEGQWDWSGQRDLKKFLQVCDELGLKVVVRCGPWCHGEVRNGGFPDWVVAHKDWKLRSTDTNFLAAVKTLYGQIATQLQGELWKDGGPVIGIQVDNEFGGPPDYLMVLKKMAINAGIDVPLYTKTGWPAMKTPPPLGELLPLFGAYADGFWERTLDPMAGANWLKFTFRSTRTDTGVGNDTLGNRQAGDTAGTEKYPYLTCEIGGGMAASYHRRMNYDPRDVESAALCQLGSGSSLMGYYMFHDGINPDGKLSTLQESTATGYPNDLPVKTYAYNSPISATGTFNPQYFWIRRLNLFLHDFGSILAPMPATLPDVQPADKADTNVLRWSVRSDGTSGFVFVNNYERLRPLPVKTNVQFKLNLPDGKLVFPQNPVTIPSDEFFFWPFNLDLGGAKMIYATAQLVCRVEEEDKRIFYFAKTPGVKAEFAFNQGDWAQNTFHFWSGETVMEHNRLIFRNVKPDREVFHYLDPLIGKTIFIVLLNQADSLALQKTDGKIVFAPPPKFSAQKIKTKIIKKTGLAREIPLVGKSHLAAAPTETDWTNAAIWKITLPKTLNLNTDPVLQIHYLGDVARVTLDGKLLEDDFYTGRNFEINLKRYAPDILTGDLRLEILPLRKAAPIFFEPGYQPDFGTNPTVLKLLSVDLVRPRGI